MLEPVTSTAIITSRSGTTRANHYHKTDWHYAYIVSGRIIYFERDVGDTQIPEPWIYRSGEMFFTPPLREHCMVFPEDTVFFTMAKNIRSHDSHESDLIRVDFINADVLPELLHKYA